MADVIVVGAGSTGLMLAGELALAGIDVVLVERRATQDLPGARARGLHARTIEVLDQRGIADRFLAEGQPMQIVGYAGVSLDISDFPTRHPYGLALLQARIEASLAGWVEELPARILRGREVTEVAQDASGASARLADGTLLRAPYLVGCDGGRSLVRKAAGIAFEGSDATTSYLLAEASMPGGPKLGFHADAQGRHAIGPLDDGEHRVGLVIQEVPPRIGDAPTFDELRRAVAAIWGSDFGLSAPTWISRFSDAARQATAYRSGRLLVAGDAAHVHSPMGGQGLNTGVQDAVNLGWKLAQVVHGTSPESLLDSYHAERHPVAAEVLQTTLAQTAAARTDDRTAALRDTLAQLLAMDEPRRHMAGMMSGLGLRYDLGDGHPLIGRRVPDLDLQIDGSPQRLFTLLHRARPVLVNFGERASADLTPWNDRVRLLNASYDGKWELPVVGVVEAPAAVLIRPDGYVAWAGELDDARLPVALDRWFGPPDPNG